MEPIGCSETSVTTNLRCVTYQKGEEFIYMAAEARNSPCFMFEISHLEFVSQL
jgi:hypothetical protein